MAATGKNTSGAAAGDDRLDAAVRAVAHAMALLWTWRSRTAVYELLGLLGPKSAAQGKSLTQEQIKEAIQSLHQAGLAAEHNVRIGYYRLTDKFRNQMYAEVLATYPASALRAALYQQAGFHAAEVRHNWPLYDLAATVALFRLELFSGTEATELNRWQQAIGRRFDWNSVFDEACFQGSFEGSLFNRINPAWRWEIAFEAAKVVCAEWKTEYLPITEWALEQTDTQAAGMPEPLRLQLAEIMLHSGQAERMQALLAGDNSGTAEAMRAALLIQQGQWVEGQAAFEAALKKRQLELGVKKRVLPETLAWYYPLALFAQQTTKTIELARKFCLGESGSRTPSPYVGWGIWAHVAAARLGEAELSHDATDFSRGTGYSIGIETLWALLLHAWMAAELPLTTPGSKARTLHDETVTQLRRRLRTCGLLWMEEQAMAAQAVLTDDDVQVPFFASAGQEAWRTVLASLRALGDDGEAVAPSASGSETRLFWELTLDKHGGVARIEPMEQKRGARGWSKPKPLPLARLTGNAALEPHDSRVACTIRPDRQHARRFNLDRAAAIMALIGHPAVVLAGNPEVIVDVVEGVPQLETIREQTKDGERFILRVTPAPHPDPANSDEWRFNMDETQRREAEALRYIHVQQDSLQRVRVIQLTPAQRRAAQLVSGRFSVPASAQNDLQDALRALAGHFSVHSDDAAAARQVPAESRLRAELAPAGEGLLLRLVVAPLGEHGPRLMPGRGRARVMAAHAGGSIGTERDLTQERQYLDSVFAALSFLDPPSSADTVCEWTVEDPELALAMVEVLPTLEAVVSVDWPRGKAVKVTTVDLRQVTMTVKSERNWFRIDGQVALDEGRVFELQALLAAAGGKSRFIALGEGAYLALSKSLREKLQALAAVAEDDKNGVRAPMIAAPWLDDVLEGAVVEFDAEFEQRIERLRAAQDITPSIPGGLQAELRTYQEDGFVWAMRLAEAGFGACLADDMGLGKTLQALAVLIARAPGGPALVVAPTSVCGNWQAEAARFAPGLTVRIYGDGERDGVIAATGVGDVLVVSYTLMQQAAEEFAAHPWHTLVADEAQAVKNATSKRSQVLFDMPADFRLALSGTPVENRLAELWSIMRFCNPGLLGSLSTFTERFGNPIERNRDRDAQRLLRRLVAPFILRRTKTQVLDDLPPRTELVLSVVPDADEAAHYEALRRHLVTEVEALSGAQAGQAHMHILAQLMKLRRAACDPRLTTPELGYVGAKVRAFAELTAELVANGHKALVFSQFVDFLRLLREPLDQAGIAYQYLDGSTPPAERTKRVAAFQAGAGDLFLISLKAGGFGLNLTAADYVVITDPWWNPAAEDQAMGRAHRIGQLRPVTVYRLVSKGTLEERIIELHHDKRALADGVLAEGEEGVTLPSTEELIALMRG